MLTPTTRTTASDAPADGAAAPTLDPLLNTLFESLGLGLLLYDGDLRVLARNYTATCLLPDADEVSQALALASVESRYQDWSASLRAVLRSTWPTRFDAVMLRADGQPDRFVNVLCAALPAGDGAAPRIGLIVLEDVTARTTMEQRLAVSERLAAVGKLCATVAHELNNPLDGILRYLNLALRIAERDHSESLRNYLASARDGTLRMVQVVRSLLEFSRNAPPAVADGNINKIVEEAVRTLEGSAAERSVSILCHFKAAHMPVIRGNSLYQVFCNLIKNAIDAMADGGTLTITTALDAHHAVIRFEDTGTGLPDNVEQLFEPFFTTKPPGQGTGLGLAVCRELVERLGGRITAANRTDGRGAVFSVQIPAPASRTAARTPEQE
ncbi:MAG: ATP-binding protein [Phycisphaerae bacterium]|nr:ATP-binding protein [Phycisphaerae bacterium]